MQITFYPPLPDSQNWTEGLYVIGQHEERDADELKRLIDIEQKLLTEARNDTHPSYTDPEITQKMTFEEIKDDLINFYTKDLINLKSNLLNLYFSAN